MTRKKNKKKQKSISNKKITQAITVIFILGFIFLVVYFNFFEDKNYPLNSEPTAVIIDQLGTSLPNQSFVTKATSLLNDANYSVDYISSDEVTVDFYKKLPEQDYDIIILRVHSTVGQVSGRSVFLLFTSEPYNKDKYKYEQIKDNVGHVMTEENGESYFGIYPDFIKYNMGGKFNDAIVIMMGCGGTIYPEMQEAFLDRGASVYFGWDERVDITHTDTATIYLLQQILVEKETMQKAAEKTNIAIGSDPTYNSTINCYFSSD